ncbi:MAG: S8 family serine peptidase [Erythrobacter sp.]|nr:S8 family serine peptidase [Erythrobacter sp.]
MMTRILPTMMMALALLLPLANPLAAQIALPQVQVPEVPDTLDGIAGRLDPTLDELDMRLQREARRLIRLRERATDRLLRQHRNLIERDARGELARRGELLVQGAGAEVLEILRHAGFPVLSTESIEGLDMTVTRIGIPAGLDLATAQSLAIELAPGADISADNLHYHSGKSTPTAAAALPMALQSAAATVRTEVGMIDGAPGPSIGVSSQKGFAKGAPFASNHGSAIASLLKSAGVARVRVADVYGTDPAGGNALAIARGLGWLTASGSKVVTISLVGPRNSVVANAIAAARRKGVVVVAAVGNDGPAAPPAYPASYEGVVAITGVDGRNRALIEAGRALHLDYAAPGADVYALDAKGKRSRWRGTSFATPLAAARIAAAMDGQADWRSAVDNEARDLGAKGTDAVYGRGLLCGKCARAN